MEQDEHNWRVGFGDDSQGWFTVPYTCSICGEVKRQGITSPMELPPPSRGCKGPTNKLHLLMDKEDAHGLRPTG